LFVFVHRVSFPEESGEITLDEFVTGCMQLHGPAKSLQLAKMSYENKAGQKPVKKCWV